MQFQTVLITGGAGFVGSNLATRFKQDMPVLNVLALDNLKRRGSELNIPRLRDAGIDFYHGDIRCPEDLDALPDFDLLIDCAAEPSVQAGANSSPRYVLHSNILGTINSLEAARDRNAAFMFLSTSRIYPLTALNQIPFREEATRFRWEHNNSVPGFSREGIAEDFPLTGTKSFYGASKLSSELIVQEYAYNYGLKAIINRCGILAGSWQMGKVDQGVISLWVSRHYFQKPLTYTGFGGEGKQVRDMLHIDDFFKLIVEQTRSFDLWDGRVYNVGGGPEVSVSLMELTALCEDETGHRITIGSTPQTNPLDIRIYLTDSRKVQQDFDWRPQRTPRDIVRDVHSWICENESMLSAVLNEGTSLKEGTSKQLVHI